MLKHLPTDSALWRYTGQSWDMSNELQASTIEVLDALLRAFIQANSKPNSKKPQPIKIPRPWEHSNKQGKKGTSIKELLGHGLKVNRIAKGGE